MTSLSTLIERLRRAAQSGEPTRDVAVVVSEFVDDGGVELVDDPFHPARKDREEGLVAPVSLTKDTAVILIRSAAGLTPVPQRHGLPVAIGILEGRVIVDVYAEDEATGELSEAGGVEVLPEEVYVVEPDVVHNVRFAGDEPGLALHVVVGDLRSAQRSRWLDGDRQHLAPSEDYPLTGLPMPLAVSDEPVKNEEPLPSDEAE